MKLSELQRKFCKAVGELIVWAFENGYELTFGEAHRTQTQADIYASQGIGIKDSKHCRRLAVDLNLFIDNKYQTTSEAYELMGIKWEALGGIWGGRWKRADGNHFEWEEG